jgi:hypothetical protein
MNPTEQLLRALELLRGGYIDAAYDIIESVIARIESQIQIKQDIK